MPSEADDDDLISSKSCACHGQGHTCKSIEGKVPDAELMPRPTGPAEAQAPEKLSTYKIAKVDHKAAPETTHAKPDPRELRRKLMAEQRAQLQAKGMSHEEIAEHMMNFDLRLCPLLDKDSVDRLAVLSKKRSVSSAYIWVMMDSGAANHVCDPVDMLLIIAYMKASQQRNSSRPLGSSSTIKVNDTYEYRLWKDPGAASLFKLLMSTHQCCPPRSCARVGTMYYIKNMVESSSTTKLGEEQPSYGEPASTTSS